MSHERVAIFVDGIDGSGKTTFCRSMAQRLRQANLGTTVLSVDDFRRSVDWTAAPQAQQYYDHYYDLAKLGECVRQFAAGDDACTFYKWKGEDQPLVAQTHQFASVLIVEGIFARRIDAPTALHVYLHVSFSCARKRILARDTGRGRTESEVRRRIDDRYFPSQRLYHKKYTPKESAHVTLDNEAPQSPRLLAIRSTDRPYQQSVLQTAIGLPLCD